MRQTFVHAKGHDVELHVCDSKDEDHLDVPRLATRRLFWVTGPIEYCDPCANWMQEIAKTLGTYVHEEPIPLPPSPDPVRAINLKGIPKTSV